MSTIDPQNTKWSKKETYGKSLMKKSGWVEGEGLGKEGQGQSEHVKTVRKDDTLGIGYTAKVGQTWSTQSVGFADLLSKLNKKEDETPSQDAEEEDVDGEAQVSSPTSKGPAMGKHGHAYSKRRKLKTEGLYSDEGKAEILGAGSSRRRGREDSDDDEDNEKSGEGTLKSLLLKRTMEYSAKYSAKPNQENADDSRVTITKPDPRPPKAKITPFNNL